MVFKKEKKLILIQILLGGIFWNLNTETTFQRFQLKSTNMKERIEKVWCKNNNHNSEQ